MKGVLIPWPLKEKNFVIYASENCWMQSKKCTNKINYSVFIKASLKFKKYYKYYYYEKNSILSII